MWNFIVENIELVWAFLAFLEMLLRVIPATRNLSIIDNLFKIIRVILPPNLKRVESKVNSVKYVQHSLEKGRELVKIVPKNFPDGR